MPRNVCVAALSTVLLGMLMMPSVRAQEGYTTVRQGARPVSQMSPTPIATPPVAGAYVGVQQPGYVQLGAPLYPAPQPNIPIWTGSTFIPTQALAPHEMLYPHTYRSLHPPYYHRVKGGYIWTPTGIKSHETWELQGTMVQVKYRSSVPVFAGWHPPRISMLGPEWK
jgi:hypothetical protein